MRGLKTFINPSASTTIFGNRNLSSIFTDFRHHWTPNRSNSPPIPLNQTGFPQTSTEKTQTRIPPNRIENDKSQAEATENFYFSAKWIPSTCGLDYWGFQHFFLLCLQSCWKWNKELCQLKIFIDKFAIRSEIFLFFRYQYRLGYRMRLESVFVVLRNVTRWIRLVADGVGLSRYCLAIMRWRKFA